MLSSNHSLFFRDYITPDKTELSDELKKKINKDFGSLDQYKQHRASNSFKPASLQQAKRFLAEKEQHESISSTNRAYTLARQAEEARKMQKAFDSHFLRIKN